ncbi:hypothetical protein TWF506_006343 [Arthrobotrys conoides]|uniref:BTB domain-containing protein n=1 Tax=Arthrobotrys conoides TaxID=74498 RepID=A0AAN8RV48_9PEZI
MTQSVPAIMQPSNEIPEPEPVPLQPELQPEPLEPPSELEIDLSDPLAGQDPFNIMPIGSSSGSSSSGNLTVMGGANSLVLSGGSQISEVSDIITRRRTDSIASAASTIYLNSRSISHRPSLEDAFSSRASSVSLSRPVTPTARKHSICEDLFSTPPTLRKPVNRAMPPPAPAPHPDFQVCETVAIVPNSDVALLVGSPNSPERCKVLASSTILTIASPYFRALLAPNRFSEGIVFQEHKHIEMLMFEEDPAAVITVCNVLHLQSRKIPAVLTGDQLAEVAIVLDKYDCVDAAWAWTRLWMSGGASKVELEADGTRGSDDAAGNAMHLITKDKDFLSKWLFIAWAFKDAAVFENCANALFWKLCEGEQEDDEFFQRLPESLQRDLIETRTACVSTLYECTQAFIDKFVDPVCDVGIQSFYYRKQSPRDCDSRVLGTTLKGLRDVELYPLVKIAKWDQTAVKLLKDLQTVGRSIFGADEHHHDITPEMIFLGDLEVARKSMRTFRMESYIR